MAGVTETAAGRELRDRLTKLEVQNRRLRQAGFLVLVLGGTALLMGPAKPEQPAKVVEAERVVLRDAAGKARAELGLKDGEPSLTLFNDKEKGRARLAVAADGSSSLTFFDQNGAGRAVLLVRPDGEPRLTFYDEKGQERTPPPAAARDSSAGATRPADVPEGPRHDERLRAAAALYGKLCARCHAADGRGGENRSRTSPTPDFTDAAWQKSRTDAQLAASILTGRGTKMPAFDDRVGAEQARALVAQVRAFGPAGARAAGTPANDFDARMGQLQKQWDELQKQVQELRKP